MKNLRNIFLETQSQLQTIDEQLKRIQNSSPDIEENLTDYTNTVNEFLQRADIKSCLIDLRSRMWHTNVKYHFVRNNPRHREQYYFALIAMVGYDNWKYIDPTIRMNWESARLSFDRMYGMVKDFSENADIYAELFDAKKPQTEEKENRKKAVSLVAKIANTEKKSEEIANKLDTLAKKFEHLETFLPPRKNLETVRDALNAWIPPEE
ncbi:MAG: hypothetical protein IJF78_02165 [Clostridia bacterium]|nr:hypothetical protein [Clostridia bacterium]